MGARFSVLRGARSIMSDWFVVATTPRKEAQAAFNLIAQGFRIFLPQMRGTVRHARRVHMVLTPLFPAYLFLDASSAGRWRSINGTFGVKHVIADNNGPIAVERGFVEALKRRADDSGVVDFSSELIPGDRVEVLAGPLARQIGTLANLGSRGRVTVLLELLAGLRPVEMAIDELLPIGGGLNHMRRFRESRAGESGYLKRGRPY